ncbi:MAG: methylthioribulose 1-phosphate dehydratase [Cuniculiplasma sp.]
MNEDQEFLKEENETYYGVKEKIIKMGNQFYSRGWLYATSGNLSSVINMDPVQLVITASGVNKGDMSVSDIIEVDSQGNGINTELKPSAETLLHLTVVRETGAKAVIHTHSIWATILSRKFSGKGYMKISGYEMLKGLDSVKTHEAEEIIPIFENSQNMTFLSGKIGNYLATNPAVHGFLLSGHGLYTWGKSMESAARNLEALEFMLEIKGRSLSSGL